MKRCPSIRNGRKSRCQRRFPIGNASPAAKQWLDQHGVQPVSRDRFEEFLKQQNAAAGKLQSNADKEALFRQFQAWEAERNAKAQARPEKPPR
jgi:hypothetical protein